MTCGLCDRFGAYNSSPIARPMAQPLLDLEPPAPDEWVAAEYAKVRWVYDNLGLSDRTAIEFFNGGHTIHGRGTFDFLHRHLKWPNPETTR